MDDKLGSSFAKRFWPRSLVTIQDLASILDIQFRISNDNLSVLCCARKYRDTCIFSVKLCNNLSLFNYILLIYHRNNLDIFVIIINFQSKENK